MTPERLKRLQELGVEATDLVGGANMRAAAAADEVAIVGVETDDSLSFGYESRAKHLGYFPERVQLLPGETAACYAIMADLATEGTMAELVPFRMMAVRRPAPGNLQ